MERALSTVGAVDSVVEERQGEEPASVDSGGLGSVQAHRAKLGGELGAMRDVVEARLLVTVAALENLLDGQHFAFLDLSRLFILGKVFFIIK